MIFITRRCSLFLFFFFLANVTKLNQSCKHSVFLNQGNTTIQILKKKTPTLIFLACPPRKKRLTLLSHFPTNLWGFPTHPTWSQSVHWHGGENRLDSSSVLKIPQWVFLNLSVSKAGLSSHFKDTADCTLHQGCGGHWRVRSREWKQRRMSSNLSPAERGF